MSFNLCIVCRLGVFVIRLRQISSIFSNYTHYRYVYFSPNCLANCRLSLIDKAWIEILCIVYSILSVLGIGGEFGLLEKTVKNKLKVICMLRPLV